MQRVSESCICMKRNVELFWSSYFYLFILFYCCVFVCVREHPDYCCTLYKLQKQITTLVRTLYNIIQYFFFFFFLLSSFSVCYAAHIRIPGIVCALCTFCVFVIHSISFNALDRKFCAHFLLLDFSRFDYCLCDCSFLFCLFLSVSFARSITIVRSLFLFWHFLSLYMYMESFEETPKITQRNILSFQKFNFSRAHAHTCSV